jgi:hypothetical protein
MNVGRIAERIVANELENLGFRVTDLNKDGIAANADLLAAKHGRTMQVQVKGSTWDLGWWFNYGFCNETMIRDRSPVFNRVDGFFKADFAILVCVKDLKDYVCVVLPILEAENAAQLNLDLFRMPKPDGSAKKPGKMWCELDYIPKTKNDKRKQILIQEQSIIGAHKDKWETVERLRS